MADKSFGVKELNLLNASGTPTVTSPNNLNLNANTVAISTSCTIGSNLDVDGHTELDNVNIAGITTLSDDLTLTGASYNVLWDKSDNQLEFGNNAKLSFGASSDLQLYSDGTNSYIKEQGSGSLYIQGINVVLENPSGTNYFAGVSGAEAIIYHNGNAKITTSSSGATVTGTLVATTFSGDPSNDSPHSLWDVVNNSASSYRFTGPGQDGAEDNPDIFLVRGQRYVFKMNASGHPFQIRVSNGGSAYSDGVTNNGAATGNLEINVQHDAPSRLYYQCTSHSSMVGNIYVIGGTRGILTQNTSLTGSSMTFDGLPSWATKITVNLLESSLSGTDQTYVRLRSGTGADVASITSDYSCVSGNYQGNLTSAKTDAFNINTTGATQLISGSMVIEKIDSAGLKYIQSHMFLCTNNNSRHGGGNLERSSGTAIVGVELTTEGSNTFDGGVVTIYYE